MVNPGLLPQSLWYSESHLPFPIPCRFEGLDLGGSFRIWTAAAQMMKGLFKTPPNLGKGTSGGGWYVWVQNW